MKKITDKEIELAIADSRASLAMEGLIPSVEVDDIIKKHLKGEISENEMFRQIGEFVRGKYYRGSEE